jgi:hypothetical protein
VTPPRETKIDLGTLLAGLGALLLVISLFLDWYGGPGDTGGITAWRSFEVVDVILAALALVALYEIAGRLAHERRWPSATGIATAAGPVGLVLVLVSIIDDPPFAQVVNSGHEAGIWLALAGTLLMTAGSLLGRVRISVVASPREPAPPPPPADPDAETRTLR